MIVRVKPEISGICRSFILPATSVISSITVIYGGCSVDESVEMPDGDEYESGKISMLPVKSPLARFMLTTDLKFKSQGGSIK